jgi:hypothetical protein
MKSTPRTAYILQIHKNPDQVNMFINQLISEGLADVFIHIDKRKYEQLSGKLVKNKHVKVLEKSIICEWGDISQVDTTIMLLREVVASNNHYDFVCLRSGQDLLVKDGFKEFLLENKNKVFMDFKSVTKKNMCAMEIKWPKKARSRYTSAHPIRIFRRVLQDLYSIGINLFPNKNFWPKEYSFYKGSQWFTIPFEVAKYIIDFLDDNEWYYNYFKNTFTPDEWFFHTLIMNSHFKSNVTNNNLLFLKWGEKFSERNSPQCLTMADIHVIEKSDNFFARKFDENIDKPVIEYYKNHARFGGNIKPKKKEVMSHA